MEKILKRYTTIPDHLYVKRKADKQLKSIIDEMERPGYVLVARQMGKTNMLLHAIRAYSDQQHLFTYIDLSTSFNDERGCYRNIIDNIMEPNEQLFSVVSGKIYADRSSNTSTPPHIEYVRELRQLLSAFGGKIIIILDEIDALRSVTYSDHIFAQIRSTYFARTNFPEFKNLTYVLSGVIEPTELIRDKNKSPFNIGEKIYLDDFNKTEHDAFVQMAKLPFDEQVSSYIYAWTNGNPRLTFDICADVEDLMIEKGSIATSDIEALIRSKYFTLYDIPPVDHIRDIVSKNKQIRHAVRSIQKKLPIESVELKRKLYLYGIISSDIDSKTVEIKNRIVSESLSLQWLDSIDRQGQDLLSLGLQKIGTEEFREAIELLEEYISNSEISPKNREVVNYNLGFAYFQENELDKAYEQFDQTFNSEEYIYAARLFKGNVKMAKGEHVESERLYHDIIDNTKPGFAYNNALLNLASYHYKDKRYDEAISYFQRLIETLELGLSKESESENRTLHLLAYSGIVQIFLEQKDFKQVLFYVEKAGEIASPVEQLELEFTKYLIAEIRDKDVLINIARKIVDNKYTFDIPAAFDISFTEYNNYRYLLELYSINELDIFEELLSYTSEVLVKNLNAAEIVFHLANNNNNQQLSVSLLKRVLRDLENLTEQLQYQSYRSLLLYEEQSNNEYNKYIHAYLEGFTNFNNTIETGDISAFANVMRFYTDKELFGAVLDTYRLIEPKLDVLPEKLKYESVIIYYWTTFAHFYRRDNRNAVIYADKTLETISKYSKVTDSVLDMKAVNTVKEHMVQIKSSTIQQVPIIRTTRKYGRNDRVKVRYQDGIVKEGKYKTFENDLLLERCFILN